MEHFTKKTLKTSRGFTYTYYTWPGLSKSESKSKNDTNTNDDVHPPLPTLLFSHGWPDHAHMFSPLISSLIHTHHISNPILIPDQLGYGETSKPTLPSDYQFSKLTQDIREILSSENISSVISIGHDWGSRLAQRMYNFHPDLVSGIILLNVAYGPPQRHPFNLAAVNKLTKEKFGYSVFEYWNLFAAPDGPTILKEGVERLYDAIHAKGPEAMRYFFCTPGVLRGYLAGDVDVDIHAAEEVTATEGGRVQVRGYASDPAVKQQFADRLRKDGFEGAQMWYVATTENWQYECERKLGEDRDKVNVPVLYVGCKEDAVCRPEMMMEAKMKGLLPDLEESPLVEAGHWGLLERPEVVGGYMAEWILRRIPKAV